MKDYFINKVLATTVVGSYPPVKGGGLWGLIDPLHAAVEIAVSDQISAGIDIISDGQVRGDMEMEEAVGEFRRLMDLAVARQLVTVGNVFTTHTPVAAGHDQFPMEMVHRLLGRAGGLRGDAGPALRQSRRPGAGASVPRARTSSNCSAGDHTLNMTFLALNLSHYVNGVAKRHGEISRLMFAGYAIDAITNGVHAVNWTRGSQRSV
jgi:hypothetical protein